ncbi:MAG: NAD(P)H-binding protein [Candidatus Saccharibacteria bacterium]|nr:NAD(P)H-binding protein [Candidatus Saccharibacteria bacterium]
MTIAILGASGYIGRNLIQRLLAETDHTIIALSQHASSMSLTHERFKKYDVDVFDTDTLHQLLLNCDTVYYLIHMMAQQKMDFVTAEAKAATQFCAAAQGTAVKRVIYLGGLGDDHEKLSAHLASRHNTGKLLRDGLPLVIEFRASMVVGQGSISYDIVTNLIHKLPILTLPKWAKTLTQPIGLQDALTYLIAGLTLDSKDHQIIEIGGPEQLSYGDLMKSYAAWEHKKMVMVKLHVIPISIAAWWLNLFTPKTHAKVGRIMVESLSHPMLVTNNKASQLFPDIHPKQLKDVFV